MNRKQVMELTGEDTRDMGIDCRNYPAPNDKFVLCVCCKNIVQTIDAKPTIEGYWACDRCWEQGREVWEAIKYDVDSDARIDREIDDEMESELN